MASTLDWSPKTTPVVAGNNSLDWSPSSPKQSVIAKPPDSSLLTFKSPTVGLSQAIKTTTPATAKTGTISTVISAAKAANPLKKETVRPLLAKEGQTQEIYGGPIVKTAHDIAARTIEAIPSAILTFAANANQVLSKGKAPPLKVPFDVSRLGIEAQPGEEHIVQDSGTKFMRNFEQLNQKDPAPFYKNFAKAYVKGPLTDIVNALVTGDIATVGAKSVLKRTAFDPEVDYALQTYGLKKSNLTGENLSSEIVRKFNQKATKLIQGGDTKGLNQLGHATNILVRKMTTRGIPQLSTLGQKLEDGARILLQDAKKGFRLDDTSVPELTPQTRTEALSGTRPIPSRQPAFKMGLSTEPVEDVGKAAPKPEGFQGFEDLTTKTLDKLKGRTSVSKQFIEDLTNAPDLKQSERDLIRDVLAKEGTQIDVKDFANKVRAELLPLTTRNPGGVSEHGRYENTNLPAELRGPVANYQEKIYQSPVKTSAGNVHFTSEDSPGYFGHTRVEDLPPTDGSQTETDVYKNTPYADLKPALAKAGDTRRVIEVQSDLFQKGRLENENNVRPAGNPIEFSDGGMGEIAPVDKFGNTIVRKAGETQKLFEARQAELAKLEPYKNNAAHFRMIREEVKQAAIDGKTKLQFPTGETAMKIEGLGDGNRFAPVRNGELVPHDLMQADIVPGAEVTPDSLGSVWVITENLGNGKFSAVPKKNYELFLKNLGGKKPTLEDMKRAAFNYGEQFDVSGTIDTENPIYKFYEKEVGRYLKNKYDAKLITDPQGVKWWEVDVKPEYAGKPVEAFKEMMETTYHLSPEQADKIFRSMFDEKEADFLFKKSIADGNALGRYSLTPGGKALVEVIERGGKVSEPVVYHEAFHTYLRSFVSKEEREALLDAQKTENESADQAEERLADSFAEYAAGKQAKPSLRDLFARILAKIKKWISGLNKVDQIYEDILARKREGGKGFGGTALKDGDKEPYIMNAKGKDMSNLKNVLSDIHGFIDKNKYDRIEIKNFGKNKDTHTIYLDGSPSTNTPSETVKTSSAPVAQEKSYDLSKHSIPSQVGFIDPTIEEQFARRKEFVDTPSHTLQRLASGPDGGSWQSLIKGFSRYLPKENKRLFYDWFATPEFVLEKLGLQKGAEMLQDAKDVYRVNKKEAINKIISWKNRADASLAKKYRYVGDNKYVEDSKGLALNKTHAAQIIFDWLDGDHKIVTEMNPELLAIAHEIKAYLKEWATRLNLPEDSQLSNYITHIFDKDAVDLPNESAFDDPELSIIMDSTPASSVYDPFLEKRTNKPGYRRDVWAALDAYVKRAARKEAMDPALEYIDKEASKLDGKAYQYVTALTHRINMRPTWIDTEIDDLVKSFAGNKFTERPTSYITKKFRNIYYRGMLGLNISSALRNLSQGANTYAKLGEKYTVIGYTKLFSRLITRNLDELYEQGVLDDALDQDKKIGVYKTVLQKADPYLFSLFELAERINRGAAYYGAKAKYWSAMKTTKGGLQIIKAGASEEQAIKYAKRIVRETQFAFSAVDAPVALSGDIAKTAFQLGSFSIKQAEFLARMVKNKEYAGLVRWTLASVAFLLTIGKLFGMKPSDLIPSVGIGGSPAGNLVFGVGELMIGNSQQKTDAKSKLQRQLISTVPAGSQLRKTVQGLEAYNAGKDVTATGKTRFKIPHTKENFIRSALFGKTSLPQAQTYYDKLDSAGKSKPKTKPNL